MIRTCLRRLSPAQASLLVPGLLFVSAVAIAGDHGSPDAAADALATEILLSRAELDALASAEVGASVVIRGLAASLAGDRTRKPVQRFDKGLDPGRDPGHDPGHHSGDDSGLDKGRLRLTRVDLFAAGAQTRQQDGTRVPRDERRFFLSRAPGPRVGLSVDAAGAIAGFIVDGGGARQLRSQGVEQSLDQDLDQSLDQRRSQSEAMLLMEPLAAAPGPRVFSCGMTHGVHTQHRWRAGGAVLRGAPKGEVVFEATVAIDTDNEFLGEKFGDDTVAADRWISDLFLALNVFMERDLGLRFVRGDTILRVSSEPDPYADAPDSYLDEFGALWLETPELRAIDRQFAALLSGREIGDGFSGVAWVDAYCENTPTFGTFGSFSINRIGAAPFITPEFVATGFGHELGHNLGSSHTHCERLRPGGDFVDQCFNAETGCYAGPTACPLDDEIAGNPVDTGSLMSYCNFTTASGGPPQPCDASAFMHPLIMGKLAGRVEANAPQCIRELLPTQPPSAIAAVISLPGEGTSELRLEAEERDGDEVRFEIIEEPEAGTRGRLSTPVRDGDLVSVTFDYTPAPGFSGTDTLTFRASDPDGASSARIQIVVEDLIFASGFE